MVTRPDFKTRTRRGVRAIEKASSMLLLPFTLHVNLLRPVRHWTIGLLALLLESTTAPNEQSLLM